MDKDNNITPEEEEKTEASFEQEWREREKDIYLSRRKKVQELEKAFGECVGHKMLVVIKGPPDPDSIASAWTHKFIAHRWGIDSQILYFDPISHPENRALVKSLAVEMIFYAPEIDLSDFSSYALVDTQSEDFPALDCMPKSTPLFSLVDHHRKTGKVKGIFIDVRENAGATCSIYAEYLQYGKYGLRKNNVEDTNLATALLHGIRTDTDNFFLAREIDWRAATYLSQFADRDLLKQIASSSLTASMMDILQKALESKDIKGNYVFAGVGFVRETDRDGIAQAADYLVRREGIDTVVVFGVVEDEYIHGSLRTRSTTMDPDTFLKDVLGSDKETGRPYGGGRADKGGFQIRLNIFSKPTDRELLWQLVSKTIKSMFMKKLGVS
jgi:nanoRNase/pAp phosphatase (c-di-AMP/oligoRNAs hydrolase)